jgi:uncharacterized protein (DUF1778 family)
LLYLNTQSTLIVVNFRKVQFMIRICPNTERIAVQSLQNQLDLATGLLRNAKECREAVIREEEVIQAAREAYRHSMNALSKLPQLSPRDMDRVENSIQEFRSALRHLVHCGHAS